VYLIVPSRGRVIVYQQNNVTMLFIQIIIKHFYLFTWATITDEDPICAPGHSWGYESLRESLDEYMGAKTYSTNTHIRPNITQ